MVNGKLCKKIILEIQICRIILICIFGLILGTLLGQVVFS